MPAANTLPHGFVEGAGSLWWQGAPLPPTLSRRRGRGGISAFLHDGPEVEAMAVQVVLVEEGLTTSRRGNDPRLRRF